MNVSDKQIALRIDWSMLNLYPGFGTNSKMPGNKKFKKPDDKMSMYISLFWLH